MRTVIENREGLDREYIEGGVQYLLNNDQEYHERSCFYDFGEPQDACFIRKEERFANDFINELISEFLK